MTTHKQLDATQRISAIASVIVAALVFAPLLSWHPMPFILIGALLFGISFLLPNSNGASAHYLATQKGKDMELLTLWDEPQVRTTVRSIAANRGSEAAMSYLRGVLDRFVYNQDGLTYQKRSAFVKTQIEYVETITKLELAKREAGRTTRQEDIKDSRLEIQEQDVDQALELGKLRHELEKENLQRQIEEARHTRSNIGKEPPVPPAPPPQPTAEEVRSRKKSDFERRKKQVLDAIRAAKADADLEEEQKQRTLNGLYEKLASIEEELIELL